MVKHDEIVSGNHTQNRLRVATIQLYQLLFYKSKSNDQNKIKQNFLLKKFFIGYKVKQNGRDISQEWKKLKIHNKEYYY